MCAPGAMPQTGPRSTPYRMAEPTQSPPAVVVVCVPWPSESRGEHLPVVLLQNSWPSEPTDAMYVAVLAYAAISLLLHENAGPRWATSALVLKSPQPFRPPAGAGTPESLIIGCSGQMPVSIMPMTTLLPA